MTFTHLFCSPAAAGMDTKDAAAAAEGWLEAPYASAAQLGKNVTYPSALAGKIGPLPPAKWVSLVTSGLDFIPYEVAFR